MSSDAVFGDSCLVGLEDVEVLTHRDLVVQFRHRQKLCRLAAECDARVRGCAWMLQQHAGDQHIVVAFLGLL